MNQNEQGRPAERPRHQHHHHHQSETVAPAGDGESAIFDVRLWITASSRAEVWAALNLFLTAAKIVAPTAVDVRYAQQRRYSHGAFVPTMQPQRRGKRAA